MCTGAEAPLIMGAIGAASSVAQLLMAPKQAKAPDVAAPEKPPQAAKAPDIPALRAANANTGGVNAGPSSTLLTGSGGVDPGTLSLGRNTLLGA